MNLAQSSISFVMSCHDKHAEFDVDQRQIGIFTAEFIAFVYKLNEYYSMCPYALHTLWCIYVTTKYENCHGDKEMTPE